MYMKEWKVVKIMFTDYNEMIEGSRVEFSEDERSKEEIERKILLRLDEAWKAYASSIGCEISEM